MPPTQAHLWISLTRTPCTLQSIPLFVLMKKLLFCTVYVLSVPLALGTLRDQKDCRQYQPSYPFHKTSVLVTYNDDKAPPIMFCCCLSMLGYFASRKSRVFAVIVKILITDSNTGISLTSFQMVSSLLRVQAILSWILLPKVVLMI